MRTTIDLPDGLYGQARRLVLERGITFRALVVACLERELNAEAPSFRLRDAAAGYHAGPGEVVDASAIEAAIDAQRQPGWRE